MCLRGKQQPISVILAIPGNDIAEAYTLQRGFSECSCMRVLHNLKGAVLYLIRDNLPMVLKPFTYPAYITCSTEKWNCFHIERIRCIFIITPL